ncbi:MAG TPA: FlgD immunoglobulin-like domain containing protein, partial [Candidatus Cloacimonadota bacterium]|nr:FlgD immunoglobulin-like domain containing protein [Candidatus Cloacimonadota bacterium]
VATRSNGGAWTTVWSLDPTDSVDPEVKTISISNADVGSTTFQFAFVFSGNSYNINYWYIDNVKLYTPFPWDLAIAEGSGDIQLSPGSSFTPICTVENAGLNTLTAVVSLLIYRGDDLVQSHLSYATYVMPGTTTQEVTFPAFTLIAPDEIYSFVYSVVSVEDVVDGDLSNNQLTKYIETYTSPRQKVLLEIGTGGWCQYCPGAAMGADDLVEEGLDIAVVENHNGDPYATDISNGRNTYYGITGYPTAIFDGVRKVVGGSNTQSMYSSYLPHYTARSAVKSPITVSIYGELDRESYSLEIWIDKLARIVRPNLVLHVALTESDIAYSWQGQTEMNFVQRTMLPGLEGTAVDLMNMTATRLEVPLSLTIGTGWLTENCELVAWVQDLDTKEVIQANMVWLPALLAPPVANNDNVAPGIQTALLGNYPNPFKSSTAISYKLATPGEVSIDIFNSRGQLVRTLENESKAVGDYQVNWDGKDNNGIRSANGIYFYKMKS